MFHTKLASPQLHSGWRRFVLAALLVAAVALALDFGALLASGHAAIQYPFGLDYGEGIVWQQALQIQSGSGYAPISGFPAIVFHYPPVYHLVTAAAAAAGGTDFLTAGRLVSFTATMLAALLAGLIVHSVIRTAAGARAALCCAVLAALIPLSATPVARWAPMMRVDMVATALALAGIRLSIAALRRPKLVHGAALCFAAAVLTKQTAVTAPMATFLALLVLRPRTGLLGIASTAVLLLLAVGGLSWTTHGEFLRHVVLYNINRFDLSRISLIENVTATHGLYVAAAAAGAALWIRSRPPQHARVKSLAALPSRLREMDGGSGMIILLGYAATTTLMLATALKLGANVNYFIDWIFAVGMVAAMGCSTGAQFALEPQREVGRPALLGLLVPSLVALQAVFLPPVPNYAYQRNPAHVAELKRLAERISVTDRPVISDDMVLLLRAGKPVVWESAIFAELSSKGVWNPQPFIDRIRRREFAFFVTEGTRGEPFDDRYTPPIIAAMNAAYPVQTVVAGYTLHLPAEGAAVSVSRPH